jgi:hypothetical protein
MMSGIYQNTFLNQWGTPEFQMTVAGSGFFKLDFLFMNWGQSEAEEYTAWIYEKRNRILFFKNKKLISHFRWDEFKGKGKGQKMRSIPGCPRRSSMVTSLSYMSIQTQEIILHVGQGFSLITATLALQNIYCVCINYTKITDDESCCRSKAVRKFKNFLTFERMPRKEVTFDGYEACFVTGNGYVK